MKKLAVNTILRETLWFGAILSCLFLVVASSALVLRSDELNQSEVRVHIDSQQPIVVLYEKADTTSGVTGLVENGSMVIVLEYKPDTNPDWAQVEQVDERGWIQLSQLSTAPLQ
jgi:hypothetical protein